MAGTAANLATRPTSLLQVVEHLIDRFRDRFDADQAARVNAAVSSCAAGVNRVHMVDGRRDGIRIHEIFSAYGAGTIFYGDQCIHVVAARPLTYGTYCAFSRRRSNLHCCWCAPPARSTNGSATTTCTSLRHRAGCAPLRLLDGATAVIETLVVSGERRASVAAPAPAGLLVFGKAADAAPAGAWRSRPGRPTLHGIRGRGTTPDTLPGGHTYDRSRTHSGCRPHGRA